MIQKSLFRFSRILYFSTFLEVSILYFLLSGFDVFGDRATAMYVVNVVCIMLTLLGCYVAFSQPRFISWLFRWVEKTQSAQQKRWEFLKVLIFSALLTFNITLYSLAAYADTPKYCVLITLVLGIYVYPRTHPTSNVSES